MANISLIFLVLFCSQNRLKTKKNLPENPTAWRPPFQYQAALDYFTEKPLGSGGSSPGGGEELELDSAVGEVCLRSGRWFVGFLLVLGGLKHVLNLVSLFFDVILQVFWVCIVKRKLKNVKHL